MNKNTGIIIGIAALAIIVGASYASTRGGDPVVPQEKAMIKADKAGTTAGTTTGNAMMKAGSYEAYSPEKLARAEAGDVVLFFHASWCPSCRSLDSDIQKNMSSIPEAVSILKVDYDKETGLRKKYGVTYQHTLVQVDKDGNLIKKWSGSPKLSNVVSEIK